jgi:hypothetical protein
MSIFKSLFKKKAPEKIIKVQEVFETRLSHAIQKLNEIGFTNVSLSDCKKLFNSLDSDVLTDKNFVQKAIRKDVLNYALLKKMPCYQDDKKASELALIAIEENISEVEYIARDIKSEEIAFNLVSRYGIALKHLHPSFRENRKIVLEAVKNNAFALECAKLFWKDDEIFELAVSEDGMILQCVSNPRYQEDSIFIKAIKSNGLAFQYGTDDQRNNLEMASFAYLRDVSSIEYLGDKIIQQPEKLIIQNFIPFLNFYLTNPNHEIASQIKDHVIKNKDKDFSKAVEKQWMKEDGYISLFQEFMDILSEHDNNNIMVKFGPFLNGILSYWSEESLKEFYEKTEHVISELQFHVTTKEYSCFKQLGYAINCESSRRNIQKVILEKEDYPKKITNSKNRKIKIK